MSSKSRSEAKGLSDEARERLATAVKKAGGQAEIARRLGISRQNLNNVLRTGQGIGAARLAAIAAEVGVSVDFLLTGGQSASDLRDAIVNIPIVEVEASAGYGRSAGAEPAVVDELPFPASYARTLGSLSSLEIVIARGKSMLPDISDGDLVMYDKSQRYRAEAMYVIVFDGELMVKRLQRSAIGILILSKNPDYGPIDVPAAEVDERLRVLGRVVWSGKQW